MPAWFQAPFEARFRHVRHRETEAVCRLLGEMDGVCCLWEFQDLKMEALYHAPAIFCGRILLHRPYCLQFDSIQTTSSSTVLFQIQIFVPCFASYEAHECHPQRAMCPEKNRRVVLLRCHPQNLRRLIPSKFRVQKALEETRRRGEWLTRIGHQNIISIHFL